MKNFLSKFKWIIGGLITAGILTAGTVYAINVTVPQSPSKGAYLSGLASGNYSATAACSDGQILAASSTSATGWACVANTAALGATTTITSNVLINGPSFTFATSNSASLLQTITGSGSTITWSLQPATGYTIPLSASTTNWNNFYNTPSTQITAGSYLTWSGNTLNSSSSPTFTSVNATNASTTNQTINTNLWLPNTKNTFLATDPNGLVISTTTPAGGSTNPAGSDTQVQYNNAGAFGANSSFTYSSTTGQLTVNGTGHVGTLRLGNQISPPQGYITLQGINDGGNSTFTFGDNGGSVAVYSGTLYTNAIPFYNSQSQLITNQNLIFNGSVFGYNSSTPQSNFVIEGISASTTPILTVASSSGTSYLSVAPSGIVTIPNASTTNLTVGTNIYLPGVSNCNFSSFLQITSGIFGCGTPAGGGGGLGAGWATSTPNIVYNNFGTVVGVNSTTPTANLVAEGISGSTTPIFVAASSSNSSLFQITAGGNVNIATLTASSLVGTDAASNLNSIALPLSTTNGGTGRVTLNTGSVPCGAGAVAVSQISPSTVYGILTSNGPGTCPTFGSIATILNGGSNIAISGTSTISFTGVLPVTNGGTGTSTAPTTMGQLLAADSTGTNYGPVNLVAGSNVTITTTTPGQITISASGSGGGGGSGVPSTTPFTAGYIPEATGTTVSLSNSNIYQTASGLVGIGTTTPAATLNVYGNSTTNPFLVSSSSGSSLLVVQQNGNVGIGTTVPTSTLVVQGSGSLPILNVASSSGVSDLYVASNGNVGIGNNSPAGTLGVTGTINASSRITGLSFVASGSGTVSAPAFNGTGAGDSDSGMYFPGSSSLGLVANGVDAVRINSLGNVGIGTTSPASLLTLQGTSSTASLLNIASSTGNSLLFVANNGNVGIGTTSPASYLQIGYDASSTASTKYDVQLGNTPLSSPSANGTYLGVNAPASFTGNLINLQVGGTNELTVSSTGLLTTPSLTVTGQTTLATASSTAMTVSGNTVLATTTVNGINILGTFDKSFTLASTTPDYLGNSFSTATYTIPSIWNPYSTTTLVSLFCETDTGTVLLNFGGQQLTCTTSGASSTPNTILTRRGNIQVQIGTESSSPNNLSVTSTFHY